MQKRRYSLCCVISLVFLHACTYQSQTIGYSDMYALIRDFEALENTAIIDVRTYKAWSAGHIQNAINIEYDTFINDLGFLIDQGEALTSMVADKEKRIVIYGTGDIKALLFAEKAIALEYRDVSCYAGGTADWETHGDYYVIEYEAFKEWHEAECPFDGENYLINVDEYGLYTGFLSPENGGHIPGAINVYYADFCSYTEGVINNGKALIDAVPDKDATVVFYCYTDW